MIVPHPETYESVKAAYNEDFLEKVFKKLKIENAKEKELFAKAIIDYGAGYLQFLKSNPPRKQPFAQKRLLDDYRQALLEAKKCYELINRDNPTSGKFHAALRNEYGDLDDLMKQMLSPYYNQTSYSEAIFYQFLDVLAQASDKAKEIDVGIAKADVSKNALGWWIASIGHAWPESSPIAFIVGDYKAPARDILLLLMNKLEKTTEANMTTAMRKAIVKGQVKHPAELLFG